MTSSKTLGVNTSAVEVTNITANGVWLLVRDRELFMPFDDFPWFREAPVGRIINVREVHEGHLYWPDLDIDLAVESIEDPSGYPLKAKH